MLLREEVEKRGVTTVVMTHSVDATSYADRIIELNDGRIQHDTGAVGRTVESAPGDA